MPQFHLHIHCDGEVIQDHEGGEFADLRSAVREAVRSVRSLVSGDVLSGVLHLDLSIDVCDDGEQSLQMVLFEDAIIARGGEGQTGRPFRSKLTASSNSTQ